MTSVDSLSVRQLRALITVDDERHFGRAAARLGTSQPSLSQMIRRIEDVVGSPLFTRRPDVRPTAAGDVFLPTARLALDRLESGMADVRRVRRGDTGRLTISFASSAMASPFPLILQRFRARWPDVEVRLRQQSTSLIPESLSADHHVGVGRFGATLPDGRCEVIVDEPFVVVVPETHALASRATVPLSALSGARLVHFPRDESPGVHDELLAAFRAAELEPEIAVEAPDWLTIVGFVAAGSGVAVVPGGFESVRWGSLAYPSIEPPAPRSRVVAVHPRTAGSPVVRAFMDAVRAARPAGTGAV
ncbi:MAG: LysR family transcriptional regulator [Gemmatimonadota bacterium]|nr:LysR family transcriptional regulator [Gemmatimonadota bacterium]